MCIQAAQLGFGEDVLISYLPLSHVAAQLLDIYVPILCGGTTYFAQPDALKVRELCCSRLLKHVYVGCCCCSGIARHHAEGGSTDRVPGRAARVGEDAGEDARDWQERDRHEEAHCHVGQGRGIPRKHQ